MKILDAAKAALERRRARRAAPAAPEPAALSIALADSIDQLNGEAWDALTAGSSLFLKRPYLRLLEANAPDNLKPRAVLVYRGRTPVAAIAVQSVDIRGSRVVRAKGPLRERALDRLHVHVLCAGNLLSWGQHAVAFAPGEEPAPLWAAVADALERLRRAHGVDGRTDLLIVKDLLAGDAIDGASLREHRYRALETEPSMIVALSPKWRSFADYLASLKSSYRNAIRKIEKDIAAAGITIKRVENVAAHAAAIHRLYLAVQEGATVRPVTIPEGYVPALARALGDDFVCTGAFRGDELVGFVITLRDGLEAVGYFIGFDRAVNQEAPIYFQLLQSIVEESILFGCKTLTLGRTALEPKARLGARPVATTAWLRHANPLLNALVAPLLRTVHHEDPPDRSPFKE